MMLRLVVIIV